MTKASSYMAVLRCYRSLNGYIVAGFNSVTASTPLEIFFYMKSSVAVVNSDIAVDIYGIYRDNSTRISRAVVYQANHPTGSYPTNL